MKAVQKAIGELEPQITSPEERKLLETIQHDIEQCKSETQTILAMIRDKKTPDAISEVLGTAQGNFTQAMDDIQATLDLKVKGATDASEASAHIYRTSQWWVVGMSLFTIGLGPFPGGIHKPPYRGAGAAGCIGSAAGCRLGPHPRGLVGTGRG